MGGKLEREGKNQRLERKRRKTDAKIVRGHLLKEILHHRESHHLPRKKRREKTTRASTEKEEDLA